MNTVTVIENTITGERRMVRGTRVEAVVAAHEEERKRNPLIFSAPGALVINPLKGECRCGVWKALD